MNEGLTPKKGEFYLGDEIDADRETYFILFRGLWNSLVDAFIGGGIVKHRWENEGKGTAVLYHKDDEEQLK